MADHERELLTLIEGTPEPQRHLEEFGREIGLSFDEVGSMVERLEREGRLRWEGERLIVVGRG